MKAKLQNELAIIDAASGRLFTEDLQRVSEKTKRFIAAAKGELTPGENEEVWREWAELLYRALREGRAWSPEYVTLLARPMLVMVAESREARRVKLAHDVANERKHLVARITSPCAQPPIEAIGILAELLETSVDDCRRAGGFLPEFVPNSGGGGEAA